MRPEKEGSEIRMNKDETNVKEIMKIIKDHVALILISGGVGIALAAILTFLIIDPRYSAETQLIATLPTTEETNAGNIDTNLRLLKTYKDFIKGNLVLNHVSEQMADQYQVDISAAELAKSIQVIQADDSQMFSIKVESTAPDTAATIANVTATVFQTDIKTVLKADQIVIVSEAVESPKPVSPNKPVDLLVGCILGLLVGLLIALFSSFFNRTLTGEQFIEDNMESPLLGSIPELSAKELESAIAKMSQPRNHADARKKDEVLSRRARR